MEERVVRFRPRAVLIVIGIFLATALILWLIWVTKDMLLWIVIAVFLAIALNPAVDWLMRHGVKRRGGAVGIVFLGAIGLDRRHRGHLRADARRTR